MLYIVLIIFRIIYQWIINNWHRWPGVITPFFHNTLHSTPKFPHPFPLTRGLYGPRSKWCYTLHITPTHRLSIFHESASCSTLLSYISWFLFFHYSHGILLLFHQVARQLGDYRKAMFLCQVQDWPGFVWEVSRMCSVSHKGAYVVLQFSGNSPARFFFFLYFCRFWAKDWSKWNFRIL